MPTHDQLLKRLKALGVGRSFSVPIEARRQLEDVVIAYRGKTIRKRFAMWIDASGLLFRVRRIANRK